MKKKNGTKVTSVDLRLTNNKHYVHGWRVDENQPTAVILYIHVHGDLTERRSYSTSILLRTEYHAPEVT